MKNLPGVGEFNLPFYWLSCERPPVSTQHNIPSESLGSPRWAKCTERLRQIAYDWVCKHEENHERRAREFSSTDVTQSVTKQTDNERIKIMVSSS